MALQPDTLETLVSGNNLNLVVKFNRGFADHPRRWAVVKPDKSASYGVAIVEGLAAVAYLNMLADGKLRDMESIVGLVLVNPMFGLEKYLSQLSQEDRFNQRRYGGKFVRHGKQVHIPGYVIAQLGQLHTILDDEDSLSDVQKSNLTKLPAAVVMHQPSLLSAFQSNSRLAQLRRVLNVANDHAVSVSLAQQVWPKVGEIIRPWLMPKQQALAYNAGQENRQ